MRTGPSLHVIGCILCLMIPLLAHADIPKDTIKIGVLRSQPYEEGGVAGQGEIIAAQLAAADFETEYVRGDAEILTDRSVEPPDKALSIVRDWLDKEHVAAILSATGPLIDSRILDMVRKRNRTLIVVSPFASARGTLCGSNLLVWSADALARSKALVNALGPQKDKRWMIVTSNSPTAVADASALQKAVNAAGGQIVGHVSGSKFQSAGQKITSSKAQVVALTQTGNDLVSVLRDRQTAHLPSGVTYAAPQAWISAVNAAGVGPAEGLVVVAPFYWDSNDATRRFAKRWGDRLGNRHVTDNAAQTYAAALSFLHAAKAVGDIGANTVLPELRRAPIKNTVLGTVTVRSDGQVVHDLSVYRVKPTGEVTSPWAYYNLVKDVPGSEAFSGKACH